jgi:hypothetical protein
LDHIHCNTTKAGTVPTQKTDIRNMPYQTDPLTAADSTKVHSHPQGKKADPKPNRKARKISVRRPIHPIVVDGNRHPICIGDIPHHTITPDTMIKNDIATPTHRSTAGDNTFKLPPKAPAKAPHMT